MGEITQEEFKVKKTAVGIVKLRICKESNIMFGRKNGINNILKRAEKQARKDIKKMNGMTDLQKYAYQQLQTAKQDLKSAKNCMKRSKDWK